VYSHSVENLLNQFESQQIQDWLLLYDAAKTTGLAKSPGWLVDALQQKWEIDQVRQQLGLLPTKSQIAPALPMEIQDQLTEIGWCGSLEELEHYYATDQERFEGWLEHICRDRDEYSRPAGMLLSNLRAGLKAPKSERSYAQYLSGHTDDTIDRDFGDSEVEPEVRFSEVDLPVEVRNAWQFALAQLRLDMSTQLFNTWVRDAYPLQYEEHTGIFEIGVMNDSARNWLESRLTATLSPLLEGILHHPVQVVFVKV
jgi:hypothetical protein